MTPKYNVGDVVRCRGSMFNNYLLWVVSIQRSPIENVIMYRVKLWTLDGCPLEQYYKFYEEELEPASVGQIELITFMRNMLS